MANVYIEARPCRPVEQFHSACCFNSTFMISADRACSLSAGSSSSSRQMSAVIREPPHKREQEWPSVASRRPPFRSRQTRQLRQKSLNRVGANSV